MVARRSSQMVAMRRYCEEKVVVSLDVHERNTYVYAVDMSSGEELSDCNIQGCLGRAVKHLAGLHLPRQRTEVVFEAGNMGYYPYRVLSKAGFAGRMIAPTSIPHRGKKQKTDRDDAHDNFQYHVAGLLHYVPIPSEQDEQARELLRYRKHVGDEVTKARQQIRSFCCRYGLFFEGTKTAWTKAHRAWLVSVEAPPLVRLQLNLRLEQLTMAEQRQENIDKQLDVVIQQDNRYRSLYEQYMLLAGIGRVTAMALILEGGALDRFAHPGRLMNYVGVVPRKAASGQTDPSLPITKAGNFYLRLALVGAAKVYGNQRAMLAAQKRIAAMQDGLHKAFCAKMLARLWTRARYLRARRKHVNKVKCAIAREMCGFIWEYYTKVINVVPASSVAA